MRVRPLLELLADGCFHSGQEIGACLGVSRTAVWKVLNTGLPQGIEIEVQKGVGYRIRGGVDLLNWNRLEHVAGTIASRNLQFHGFDSIASTNAFLMDPSLQMGRKDAHVCIAECQTEGRGRRGRAWSSPYAKNVYMSIAFSLSGGAERLSGLSLVAGIAFANAIKGLGISGISLKWPNDLYLDGKKLGGILVELTGSPVDGWKVVVGVGLNVHMTEGEATKGIEQRWVSLAGEGGQSTVGRNDVAEALLCSFFMIVDRYEEQGFAAFVNDWDGYDYLKGKRIYLLGGQAEGIALGVSDSGALLLQLESGELMELNAGEVSVRERVS